MRPSGLATRCRRNARLRGLIDDESSASIPATGSMLRLMRSMRRASSDWLGPVEGNWRMGWRRRRRRRFGRHWRAGVVRPSVIWLSSRRCGLRRPGLVSCACRVWPIGWRPTCCSAGMSPSWASWIRCAGRTRTTSGCAACTCGHFLVRGGPAMRCSCSPRLGRRSSRISVWSPRPSFAGWSTRSSPGRGGGDFPGGRGRQ